MIDKSAADELFRRIFRSGMMRRLPKKQQDAEVVLAISVLALDAERFYDESEINVNLAAWLDGIAADNGLDYVTLRRYLVDLGFLRRASDGAIYRVDPERIDAVLCHDAKSVDAKEIFDEVQAARRRRRLAFRQ